MLQSFILVNQQERRMNAMNVYDLHDNTVLFVALFIAIQDSP